MSDVKRPTLRVVSPSETAPPTPDPLPPAPPAPAPVVYMPSSEGSAYAQATDQLDASVPICAGLLVCSGLLLVEGALGFYHQAAAHAPPSTFRRGVPPGLKSAEATHTWLLTHLVQVKALARSVPGQPKAPYPRCKDLAQAARLAAEELDRAFAATRAAGLQLDERRSDLFKAALADLDAVDSFLAKKNAALWEPVEEDDVVVAGQYAFGAAVLGARG